MDIKAVTNEKTPTDTILMIPPVTTINVRLTFDSDGSMRLTGYYDSTEALQRAVIIKNVALPPTVESE